MKEYRVKYKSIIGDLEIVSDEDSIIKVEPMKQDFEDSKNIPQILKECTSQLDEYFNGTRKEFSLKLKLVGTQFQKEVWNELMKIPYGKVVSYEDIAIKIGNEKACRAVGNANNKNNIMIIIPCHRVIGKNGSLVGYACGLDVKKKLLDMENKNTNI